MMRPPILQVALFRDHAEDPLEHERSRLAMILLLEWLAQYDRLWMKTYKDTPMIYESGVKYVHKAGKEASCWQGIETCLMKKTGDCKDFAAWRCAELREIHGVDCHPAILWRKVGDAYRFHAVVEFPDMSQEDPSVILGMKAPEGYQNGSILSGPLTRRKQVDVNSIAAAIMQGLTSNNPALQRQAKASIAKLKMMSEDDPESAKILATVQYQCAALRKRLKSNMQKETTLGSFIKKGFRWTLSNLYHAGVRGPEAAIARDMKKDGATVIGSDEILGAAVPNLPGHRSFPALKVKAKKAIDRAAKAKSQAAKALAKAHTQAAAAKKTGGASAAGGFLSSLIKVGGKPLGASKTPARPMSSGRATLHGLTDIVDEIVGDDPFQDFASGVSRGVYNIYESAGSMELIGELTEILGDYEIVGDAISDVMSNIDNQVQALQQTIQNLSAQDADIQNRISVFQGYAPGFPGLQMIQVALQAEDNDLQNQIASASAQIDTLNAAVDQMTQNLQSLAQQQAQYGQGLANVQALQQQVASGPSYTPLDPSQVQQAPLPPPNIPMGPDYSQDYGYGGGYAPDYSGQGGGSGYEIPYDNSYDDGSSDLSDDGSTDDSDMSDLSGMEEIIGYVDDTSRQAMQVASDATPVLSVATAFIPGVGPLLAPLTPEAVKFANETIVKAEGGDPKASGHIANVRAKAKEGDPDAIQQADALSRVHKARQLTKGSSRKPFKNSLSNWYTAGVVGVNAVK